jgi:hypothetical protein
MVEVLPAPLHVAALESRWFAAIALFGWSSGGAAEAHLTVTRSSRAWLLGWFACLAGLLTLTLLTLTLLTLSGLPLLARLPLSTRRATTTARLAAALA